MPLQTIVTDGLVEITINVIFLPGMIPFFHTNHKVQKSSIRSYKCFEPLNAL